MRFVRFGHTTVRCALAFTLATLVAGCANGLAAVPLPAPGLGGRSYSLTAVFDSALNLPSRAKVKLNGADIGEVESLWAKNFTAHVKMRIRADAPVYSGATAELRSATPLGDLFVAIHPDPNQSSSATMLHDGAMIPPSSTSAAATIEELLTSMTLLVNGGAIRHLVSIFNGTGLAVGGRGEKLNALLHQSTALIARLNSRSSQIDGVLRGTSELTAQLAARRKVIDEALTAAGPATKVIADNITEVADVTDTLARISRQVSRFPSLKGTDNRSTVADLNHMSAAFNEIALDPDLSMNPFNRFIGIFTKTTHATSARVNVDIRKLALGWLPDKNYPGDPQMHFPDGTDYHAMIGSLRYEWNILLGKIYGPER